MSNKEMTIREKAIEQLERISRNLATIGEKEDYTGVAIQVLKQTRWIPVSERLPKPKLIAKYYLVQNEYGDMMVARWDGNGWEQMYQHEYLEDEVVAWTPLPRRYKAESEGEDDKRRSNKGIENI